MQCLAAGRRKKRNRRRQPYQGRPNKGAKSKNPTDPSKKTTSWPILGSEHSDSSPVSQFVALIKNIGDVEPELEQTVFFRQVKHVGESQIQWIVPRQFIRVRKATSQAAAIKEVSIDRGVFVGVRSAGRNGVTLIMVQEDPVVRIKASSSGSKRN